MYSLHDVRRKRLITDVDWDILYSLAVGFTIIIRLGVVYG